VPYLLNPVGIVGLMTISAEAKSLGVFAVEFGILVFVLLLDVVVFRWANRVSDKLDESRMLVTEKVFGFLIAAIAVQLVLDGAEPGRSHRACPALGRWVTPAAPCPDRTGQRRPAGAGGREQPPPRGRPRAGTDAGPGSSESSRTPHHAAPWPGWGSRTTRTVWSCPATRPLVAPDSNDDSDSSDQRQAAATGDSAGRAHIARQLGICHA
jgi:hypothetical protein